MGSARTDPLRQPRARIPKRDLAAACLKISGLSALLARVPSWRGAIVLSYHRVGDKSACDLYRGVFTATADELDEQLRFLTRRFDVIAPADFGAELLSRRGRHVLVTFDDGYRDLYDVAGPVLDAHGVHAAMFLCSGFIDGRATAWWDEIAWMLRRCEAPELIPGPWSPTPIALNPLEAVIDRLTRRYWELEPVDAAGFLDLLAEATGAGRRPQPAHAADWITWEMAREMQAAGHEVGAHTVTHPILARLAPERQLKEILGSVDRIGAQIGHRPRWFAYPVGLTGTFDQRTRDAARAAGVDLAFANLAGRLTASNFRPLEIRRVAVESLRNPSVFAGTLALPQVFLPGV